jgi:heme oxygenase
LTGLRTNAGLHYGYQGFKFIARGPIFDMQPEESVLNRLRKATRTIHHRIDAGLNAVEEFASPSGRTRLTRRYYLLHAPAEAALSPWLEGLREVQFNRRRKTQLLESALSRLGSEQPLIKESDRPRLSSQAEALGWLYVLEGSALGGRVIQRALIARGVDLTGLEFLNPYGRATAWQWKAFLSILENEAGADATRSEAAVRGGLSGFRYAERCLSGALEA